MPTRFDHPQTGCHCPGHERRREQQRRSKEHNGQHQLKVRDHQREAVETAIARNASRGTWSLSQVQLESGESAEVVWSVWNAMNIRTFGKKAAS